MRSNFWKAAVLLGAVLVIAVVIISSFKKSVLRTAPPGSQQTVAALTITPPVAPNPEDLFEDVTSKAGLRFTNQYCDSRIANILESNGAGGVWLDYDGDGWMDLYLVNSGPLEGVTHHAPGTAREPNRLFRNRGDGTFEDVTIKAGVQGAGYGTPA